MQHVHKAIITGLAMLALSMLPLTSQATTSIGKVIVSIGNVVAIDSSGKERALKRRGKLFEGDTIKLGDKSRLQARFIDNQLVALKQNTVFRIDDYKFNGKQDGSESAAMSLLKGGMRSVTGAIGKVNKAAYKVKTPVATLGVRGTIWNGQICHAGSCGPDVDDGFYGAVSEGAVVINNQAGERVFKQDQFFHVLTPTTQPVQITNPPNIIVENEKPSKSEVAEAQQEVKEAAREATQTSADGESTVLSQDGETKLALITTTSDGTGNVTGEISTDVTGTTGTTDTLTGPGSDSTTTTFTSGGQTTQTTTGGTVSTGGTTTTAALPIPGMTAPPGAGVALAAILAPGDAGGTWLVHDGGSDQIQIATVGGAANQLVYAFENDQLDCNPSCTVTVYDNGILSEVGGNGAIGVNWGRWSSGAEVDDSGTITSLDATGGLAFVYSPNVTTPIQLSGLVEFGTQTYNFSGGPTARDETGAAVTVSSGSIVANFGSGTITGMNMALSGNGRNYNASYSGTTFFGNDIIFNSASCSGGLCGTGTALSGEAGGFFVGPNAEGLAGWFGLYDLGQTGIGVAGAGLFVR